MLVMQTKFIDLICQSFAYDQGFKMLSCYSNTGFQFYLLIIMLLPMFIVPFNLVYYQTLL